MNKLNAEEVARELLENKKDSTMKFFGKEFLAMTKRVVEMFKHYGYDLYVTKKDKE